MHTKILHDLMQDKEALERSSDKGGLSFIHGVGIKDEKDIYIDPDDLVGHTLVIGSTRVGKTTGYNLFITHAIKKGETVIVFDPKRDIGLLNRIVEACRKYGRENDFMLFALPYPKISAYYNPLKNFTLPNEIPDRIAMLLPSGGSSDSFKSFSKNVVSSVVNSLFFLEENVNFKKVFMYSLNKMNELARRCVEKCFKDKKMEHILEETISSAVGSDYKNKLTVDFDETLTKIYISAYKKYPEVHNEKIESLLTNVLHPKEHYQKMSQSLIPVLGQFIDGEIGEIMNDVAPLDRQVITWDSVVKNKKVVYMCFGSLLLQDTAKVIIKITLRDFVSFIGARYCYASKFEPINLFIDEFSEVVDENFGNFINKCGGANVRVFLATQSGADIEAMLGSSAKAQQIYDNVNIKLWLRTTDINTAEIFSNSAGTITIEKQSDGYSVTPKTEGESEGVVYKSSYSKSLSEQKTYLIDPSWILKLPKGQGFLAYSGKVYKVRIPLLPKPQVNYLKEIGYTIEDENIFDEEEEE